MVKLMPLMFTLEELPSDEVVFKVCGVPVVSSSTWTSVFPLELMRLVITVEVENSVSPAVMFVPTGAPEQLRMISPTRSVTPSERMRAGTAEVVQLSCWPWAAKVAAKKIEIFVK